MPSLPPTARLLDLILRDKIGISLEEYVTQLRGDDRTWAYITDRVQALTGEQFQHDLLRSVFRRIRRTKPGQIAS